MFPNLFAVDPAYAVAVISGVLDSDHARALDHALTATLPDDHATDLAGILAYRDPYPFPGDDQPRFLVEYAAIFGNSHFLPGSSRPDIDADYARAVYVYLVITQPTIIVDDGWDDHFLCHCADYAVWLTDYDDRLPYPDPAVLSLYFDDDRNDPPIG